LSIWGSSPDAYKPELARSTFLKANVLFLQNKDDSVHVDEVALFEKAVRMLQELGKGADKDAGDLTEADFDDLITFWSC